MIHRFYVRLTTYFNSQPHKEADDLITSFLHPCQISTHSLTRRLTSLFCCKRNHQVISTHSLTRRLTVMRYALHRSTKISTHSLTRRLTWVCCTTALFGFYFNSQPHKEADTIYTYSDLRIEHFNSQPHKEADIF